MSSKEETKRLRKLLQVRLETDKILSDNLGTGFNSHFHEAEGTEEIQRILTTEIVFLEQLIEEFNRYPDTLEVPGYSLSQYQTFQRNAQETSDKFFKNRNP